MFGGLRGTVILLVGDEGGQTAVLVVPSLVVWTPLSKRKGGVVSKDGSAFGRW